MRALIVPQKEKSFFMDIVERTLDGFSEVSVAPDAQSAFELLKTGEFDFIFLHGSSNSGEGGASVLRDVMDATMSNPLRQSPVIFALSKDASGMTFLRKPEPGGGRVIQSGYEEFLGKLLGEESLSWVQAVVESLEKNNSASRRIPVPTEKIHADLLQPR